MTIARRLDDGGRREEPRQAAEIAKVMLLEEIRERRGALVIVPDVERSHRCPEIDRRIGRRRGTQRC
jgi:hypothetical protein